MLLKGERLPYVHGGEGVAQRLPVTLTSEQWPCAAVLALTPPRLGGAYGRTLMWVGGVGRAWASVQVSLYPGRSGDGPITAA